jgi:hypothetical protein
MVPQQTGVPPIIRQQVQPAFRQAIMQSQQPWIMATHAGSPLVHIIVQPSLVISVLHMPIIMLQLQTIMPFIMQQHEHMPPASIVQRFCIMARATASSHTQVIFMPPDIFSTIILQRGTIIMFGAIGAAPIPGIGEVPIPGIPIPVRSIIIVLVMNHYSLGDQSLGCEVRRSGGLVAGPKPEKIVEIPCLPLIRGQTLLGFLSGNPTSGMILVQ